MLAKVKKFFLQRFYIVGIYWWCLWSRAYRWLFHRKYQQYSTPVDKGGCLTIDEASEKMEKLLWTKDGLKELWDSVGSDGWVQFVLNSVEDGKGQPPGALDCDDFSFWATRVLQPRYKPVIFIFTWMSGKKMHGHAMCWCETGTGYVHIGNWGKSKEYDSLLPACEEILSKYNDSSAVGWSLLTNDLWPICWGTGLPGKEVTNG